MKKPISPLVKVGIIGAALLLLTNQGKSDNQVPDPHDLPEPDPDEIPDNVPDDIRDDPDYMKIQSAITFLLTKPDPYFYFFRWLYKWPNADVAAQAIFNIVNATGLGGMFATDDSTLTNPNSPYLIAKNINPQFFLNTNWPADHYKYFVYHGVDAVVGSPRTDSDTILQIWITLICTDTRETVWGGWKAWEAKHARVADLSKGGVMRDVFNAAQEAAKITPTISYAQFIYPDTGYIAPDYYGAAVEAIYLAKWEFNWFSARGIDPIKVAIWIGKEMMKLFGKGGDDVEIPPYVP